MHSIVDGDAAIVLDDRHAPIFVSTWFGIATETVIRGYFGWVRGIVERGLQAQEPFVFIIDALDAARPLPSVRHLIAELTDEMPGYESVNAGGYLVSDSVMVRSAVTAMQWLTRRKLKSIPVESNTEAFRRGLEDLLRVGVTPPKIDPYTYQRPLRPSSQRAPSHTK